MSTKSTIYYNDEFPDSPFGSFHIYWQHLTKEFRIELETIDGYCDMVLPKVIVDALALKYEKGILTSNIKKEEK